MTQEQNVLKDLEWSVRNHTENRKENQQQTNKQKKRGKQVEKFIYQKYYCIGEKT